MTRTHRPANAYAKEPPPVPYDPWPAIGRLLRALDGPQLSDPAARALAREVLAGLISRRHGAEVDSDGAGRVIGSISSQKQG